MFMLYFQIFKIFDFSDENADKEANIIYNTNQLQHIDESATTSKLDSVLVDLVVLELYQFQNKMGFILVKATSSAPYSITPRHQRHIASRLVQMECFLRLA